MAAPVPVLQSLSPTAFRRRAHALAATRDCEVEFCPADGGAPTAIDPGEIGQAPGRAVLWVRSDAGEREAIGMTEIPRAPEPRPALDPAARWDALAVSLQAQLAASLAREEVIRHALDAKAAEVLKLATELAEVRAGRSDSPFTPETFQAAAPLVERLVVAWEGRRVDDAFASFFESIADEAERDRVLDLFAAWHRRGKAG